MTLIVNVVVVDVQHNAALAIVTGGVQGEATTTTSNAHLLVAVCSFIVGFVSFVVVIPLHAVVVNFVDDREPDATVQPCTRVLGLLLDYLFTTSHGAAYECPCSSSFSIFFDQSSWCRRPMLLGGAERGSKATYQSIAHAVTVRHSLSVLSFRL